MFWGCIGPNGVGPLVVCDGKINAQKYITVLHDNLFTCVDQMLGEEGCPFIFLQDNAPHIVPDQQRVTFKFMVFIPGLLTVAI